MAEWFYLERVLADQARALRDHLAKRAAFRPIDMQEERAVLHSGFEGWSWLRAAQVGALVGLALLGTLALPTGILGVAWALRGILELFTG